MSVQEIEMLENKFILRLLAHFCTSISQTWKKHII